MHTVTFYPVGNGDTSQIILENRKRILFDFNHVVKGENDKNPEININRTYAKCAESTRENSIFYLI